MANIAHISADNTHAVYTRIHNQLVALGHTPTYINENDVDTTDFSSYDLIYVGRVTYSDAYVRTPFAQDLLDVGRSKPMLVGVGYGGAPSSYYTTLTGQGSHLLQMGLTGSIAGTSLVSTARADVAHDISAGMTVGTSYAFWSANTQTQAGFSTWIGTNVIEGNAGDRGDDAMVIAIEAGTETLQGDLLRNRVVVFPTYLGVDLAAQGATILGNAITWALGGTPVTQTGLRGSKVAAYALVGPPKDAVAASKVAVYAVMRPPAVGVTAPKIVAYAVMEPGSEGGDPPAVTKRRVSNINFV